MSIDTLGDPPQTALALGLPHTPGIPLAAIIREQEARIGFAAVPRCPNVFRHPLQAAAWLARLLLGLVSLLVLLSLAATYPVTNLLALGYLLYAQGCVARSGRLRDAVPLLPAAGRLGVIALFTFLWLVPVSYLADAARDARLIAPASQAAWLRYVALAIVAAMVAVHLVLAVARGGSCGCFLRPVKNVRWLIERLRRGDYFSLADGEIRAFVSDLRPGHVLRLGACGLIGTLAWLIIPSLLFAALSDPTRTWQQLAVLAGGAMLVPILCWLPFLQAHMAAEDRLRAIFELGAVRELFRSAPFSWLLATAVFYLASFPLFYWSVYPKMDLQYHRGILDLTLISVALMFPARILVGRVYRRASAHQAAWRGWPWLVRPVLAVLVSLYVYLLFLSGSTAEFGRHWLNQYHALLLPLPW